MVSVADGTSCDDGAPCTGYDSVAQGDQCNKGICVGGENFCECKTHSDCVDPDSDVCTGTPVCIDNSCQNDLSTVITCQSVNDTACSKNTCNAITGACSVVAQTGDSCDDSDVCTTGTTCTSEGVCGASLGDPCECMKDSDCTDPDNDVCTGVPYCNKDTSGPYECVNNPATVVSYSTANDTCSFGSCVAGSNACACTENIDCPDDGNLCNGTPYCDKSGGVNECKTNPASVVTCSTANDTTCSQDQCIPGLGTCEAVAVNDGGSCEADGQSCTTDTCSSGLCVEGPATSCVACTGTNDCAGLDCGGTPFFCNGTVCSCAA